MYIGVATNHACRLQWVLINSYTHISEAMQIHEDGQVDLYQKKKEVQM